jgi:hypothetical protein
MHVRPLRPHMRPQFVTTIKESSQVPPFPSARLPRDTTLKATRGWPVYYPNIHHYKRGEVLSISTTIEATKFAGPNKSRMC